jgi:hypothetical protein
MHCTEVARMSGAGRSYLHAVHFLCRLRVVPSYAGVLLQVAVLYGPKAPFGMTKKLFFYNSQKKKLFKAVFRSKNFGKKFM